MYSKEELLTMLKAIEAHETETRFAEPKDIFSRLAEYREKEKEHFLVIGLNGAHKEVYLEVSSIGSMDRTIVHPREVFRKAVSEGVAAIIIAHNHPSGKTEPSPEDNALSGRLKEAGEIMGIPVLDHIIIAKTGYYSFLEAGKM